MILPPYRSMRVFTMYSPRPFPPPLVPFCLNLVNITSFTESGIPGPVSSTETITSSSPPLSTVILTDTPMPPNLTLLPMRFEKTTPRRSSAQTCAPLSVNLISVSGKCAISCLITLSRSISTNSSSFSSILRIVSSDRITSLLLCIPSITREARSFDSPSTISMRRSPYHNDARFALLMSCIMISR